MLSGGQSSGEPPSTVCTELWEIQAPEAIVKCQSYVHVNQQKSWCTHLWGIGKPGWGDGGGDAYSPSFHLCHPLPFLRVVQAVAMVL